MKTLFALLICLLTLSSISAQESQTLVSVQSSGQLICGVDEEVFGFGFLNPNTGDISGLQIDFCRAVAAAVLGEASAVDLRLHTLDTPLDELLSGDLDLLFQHNFSFDFMETTQANLRLGAAVVYYDGASVMSRVGTNIVDLEDLDAETVCVVEDSPDVRALVTRMDEVDLQIDLIEFDTIAEMRDNFFDGRCTAQILDRSLLEIIRFSTENPYDFEVWPIPFTVRPLVPLTQNSDEQWGKIVDAVFWGLIHAEELGLSSESIEEYVRFDGESDDAYVARVGAPMARFLDAQLGAGGTLGLPNDFMLQVIRQVGNYEEIYMRHMGPETSLYVVRGLNDLWFSGGLLYAPNW